MSRVLATTNPVAVDSEVMMPGFSGSASDRNHTGEELPTQDLSSASLGPAPA